MAKVSATLPVTRDLSPDGLLAAPRFTPPARLDVADLLLVNVGRLAVPKVGRKVLLHHDTIPCVIHDYDGQEILWVTRALRALNGEELSPATLHTYAKGFLRAARPMWALGVDPQDLTITEYAVVRSWLRSCMRRSKQKPNDAARPLSASTLIQTESALLAIYDVAFRHGLIASNPIQDFRGNYDDESLGMGTRYFDEDPVLGRKKKRKGGGSRAIARVVEKEIVTVSAVDRAALRSAPRLRDRALWTLGLDSGPRISECLSITPSTYQPQWSRALVVGKGLGGALRTIPLGPATIEAIDVYLEELAQQGFRPGPDDQIFRSIKSPFAPLQYNAAWKALRRALNNDRIHPHALRHTAATELLDLLPGTPGSRLLKVQITLGHKHLTTTQRYLHQDLPDVVAAHVLARQSKPRKGSAVLARTYGPDELALLNEIRKER